MNLEKVSWSIVAFIFGQPPYTSGNGCYLKTITRRSFSTLSITYIRIIIDVFGFVIMPNHIHLIWRMKELNGKETPQGSFLKYTAHEFRKLILADGDNRLVSYAVNAANKKHEFWQRDPLAIELYTRKVAFQKLDYLHFNPCTEYWQLAASPGEYYFSSANFYETGKIDFPFLSDLRDEF